jgi:hypothetical protein
MSLGSWYELTKLLLETETDEDPESATRKEANRLRVRSVVALSLGMAAEVLERADLQRGSEWGAALTEEAKGYIDLARATVDLSERLGYL